MRRFSSHWALLATLGLTIYQCACSSNSVSAVAAAPLPSKPATENSSQSESAAGDFIASGPMVVENQIELAAQRDGVVAQVLVEAGATVKKGQILARLDDRQLTADKDAAAAKARSLDADLKNWESGAKVAESARDRAEKLWAGENYCQV